METVDVKKKKEIRYHAERCMYFNELLIKQCDSWLSAEEGNANMIKCIEERKRKEREEQIKSKNPTKSEKRFWKLIIKSLN